jgi:hypothetical protein
MASQPHEAWVSVTAARPQAGVLAAEQPEVADCTPDVIVGDGGFGTVQARIPELNGETLITRYTLRELLDKLDELRP